MGASQHPIPEPLPALVLIHGLGGPLMWQRLEPLLAKHTQVISVKLPGFGGEPAPPRTMTATDHAAYVARKLDELGIEQAHIAGISYGGQIAITFAAQFPQRVGKLMLLCSTGFMPDRFLISNALTWSLIRPIVSHTILRSRSLMCRFGASSFYDIASRPTDLCAAFFTQLSQSGAREAWLAAVHEISTGRDQFSRILKSVSAPTMIFWGENDITVPPSHAPEFLAAIPGSRLITFPNCAHSIPLEKPHELCEEIRRFIST